MLLTTQDIGMISVIKVAGGRLTSADYGSLKQAQTRMTERGRTALLVDLQAVRSVTQSGLAALLELQGEAPRSGVIGFYGARPSVRKAIEKAGLLPLLTLFETQNEALTASEFRARRLCGVKSVILVAGVGSRMAPLTREVPKPMLDILGRPIVDHLMDHMQSFGLRDFILNPGYLAPAFHAHLQTSPQRSIQFANEGRYVHNRWYAAPLGSAGTLYAIQEQSSAFDADFFVLCGDTLCDLDFAAMMEQHRARDADVTVAVQTVSPDLVQKYGIVDADGAGRINGFVEKPAPERAPTNLASTGIYIFNPRVLDMFPDLWTAGQPLDIAQDLLPAILRAGGRMDSYEAGFQWVDVGCVRDYFEAVSTGLRRLLPTLKPEGAELRRQVWCAPGAEVSPRAVIVGPCYIGPGAVVETGARIDGPSVISAGARISSRALVRRSVIMPNTCVAPGAWVDGMVASGDWAVDHRFADGSDQTSRPLEGVTAIRSDQNMGQIALAGGR